MRTTAHTFWLRQRVQVWRERLNRLGRPRFVRRVGAVGFNRVTWLPGRDRAVVRSNALAQVRQKREHVARELFAARALEGSLISLAAVLGTEVRDPDGRKVGRMTDLVVRWTKSQPYPGVSSVVMRAGDDELVVGIRWVTIASPGTVRLRSSAAHVRAPERHPADVALAHDVLDRQVVDAEGLQLVRPSDVYLAHVHGRVELIGLEIGPGALLRRLGPRSLRSRMRPRHVIDWATIGSFSSPRQDGDQAGGRQADLAGRAGTGLVLNASSGEVQRWRASEVQAALEAARAGDAEQSG